MMSEASTVWRDLHTRQSAAINRHRRSVSLAIALLIAMCAAEVLFLAYVAGPDTVELLTAAEGMAVGTASGVP